MIKTFTLIAIALLTLLPSGGSSSVPQTTQNTVTKQVKEESTVEWVNSTLVPATAAIYYKDQDGDYDDNCSAHAFLRTQKGYLFITASHCFTAYFFGNQMKIPYRFFVNKHDPDKPHYEEIASAWIGSGANGFDIAIFEVITTEEYAVVPLGKDATRFLEPVVNISDPKGRGLLANIGWVERPANNRNNVDKFMGINWTNYLMVKIPGTDAGSSGSAVICADQRAVCGMIVGRNGEQWYALPVSKIWQFYNQVVVPDMAKSH